MWKPATSHNVPSRRWTDRDAFTVRELGFFSDVFIVGAVWICVDLGGSTRFDTS